MKTEDKIGYGFLGLVLVIGIPVLIFALGRQSHETAAHPTVEDLSPGLANVEPQHPQERGVNSAKPPVLPTPSESPSDAIQDSNPQENETSIVDTAHGRQPGAPSEGPAEAKDAPLAVDSDSKSTSERNQTMLQGIFEWDGSAFVFEPDGYFIRIDFVNSGLVKLGDGSFEVGKMLDEDSREMNFSGDEGVMTLIYDETGKNGTNPIGFIFREDDSNDRRFLSINREDFLRQLDRVSGKLDFRSNTDREWRPK